MTTEIVIFRREYNKYTKEHGFLACFPDDEANLGRIQSLPFHFSGVLTIYECHDEISLDYFYHRKIVHKDDPIIPKLVDALKRFYGDDISFKVIEKIPQKRQTR